VSIASPTILSIQKYLHKNIYIQRRLHGCDIEMGYLNSWSKKSTRCKNMAWAEFKRPYPQANLTKFTTEANVDEHHNVTAEADGLLQSVSGSDPKYWSQDMKDALGLVTDGINNNNNNNMHYLIIICAFSIK